MDTLKGWERETAPLWGRVAITEPSGRTVEVDTPSGWTLADWQAYAERYHGPGGAVTPIAGLTKPPGPTSKTPYGALARAVVGQVFTARFEPWMALPGAKPRLKGWGERVVRLTPKPTPMDILYEGQEAGEPLEATFARIGAAYPELTGDEMQAVIQDYQAWLQNRIERQKALARGLDRVRRIVRPAMDEDPSLTIGEAMRVMAGRGCEAAQRELGRWREMERANEAAGP